MVKEREKLFDKIEELNKQLNPHNFVKYKQELEQKYEYLKIIDEEEKVEKEIEEILLKIQKIFLKCIQKDVQNVTTKQQILKIIYQYRYYILLPFNTEKRIVDIEKLRKDIEETSKVIINKAQEIKILTKIAQNKELEYKILKNIFTSRIIKLENAELKITKEKEKIYLQLFDEKLFENKIEIGNKDEIQQKEFKIRINKRIKVFE